MLSATPAPRPDTLVLAGLVAVIVLSWVWLMTEAGLKMDDMDMGGGRIMLMAEPPWTVQYAAMIFLTCGSS